MPLFMMHATLKTSALRTYGKNPQELLERVRAVQLEHNSTFLAMYSALGRWDYVIVLDATDTKQASEISVDISLETGLRIQTMPVARLDLDTLRLPPEESPVREPATPPDPTRSASESRRTPPRSTDEEPARSRAPRQQPTVERH